MAKANFGHCCVCIMELPIEYLNHVSSKCPRCNAPKAELTEGECDAYLAERGMAEYEDAYFEKYDLIVEYYYLTPKGEKVIATTDRVIHSTR